LIGSQEESRQVSHRVWRPAALIALTAVAPIALADDEAPTSTQRSSEERWDALSDAQVADIAARDWLDESHWLELPEAGPLVAPSRLKSPPLPSCRPLSPEEDWIASARKGANGRYVISRGGSEQVLTLDPELQDKLQQILLSYQTPYGAVVAMEPSTGRVLAMAEHSAEQPHLRGLTTRAVFPAASIFKIVTASALLEFGVQPDSPECFHGGKRRISEKLLVDSRSDRRCYSLSTALAMSANVVFAKLTFKHLSSEQLEATAEAFHFNRPLEFVVPTDTSLASIPSDPLGLASAGSGFGDVYLSPLHGAAIAASIANGGLWRDPILINEPAPSAEPERVVAEGVARELADMLEETVTLGTARRTFRERGFRVQGAVGKTGSLADHNPYRDYSWFVGFAPKNNPQVAVAAVVVNTAKWRIRATWLGREAMRLYLEAKDSLTNRLPRRAPHPQDSLSRASPIPSERSAETTSALLAPESATR
jgi:membrane peptidoglycan carboxypeptidase